MSGIKVICVVLMALFLTVCAEAQQWETLFNGKDLSGWEFVGKGKATVENGEISLAWDEANPGGGWLMTTEQFENFQVTADYYAPGRTNSGFALRYQGEREEDPAFYAYEIQIFNDQGGAQDFTGSIYKLARSFWPPNIKADDWNTFDVTADGDHIVVKLNGDKINEVHDRRSLRGALGFQSHDKNTVVKLRNIRIRRLPQQTNLGPQIEDWMHRTNKSDFEPLFNGADLSGWSVVGKADWSVKDGVITGKNPGETGSFLVTDAMYKNYYLKLKFKIEKDNNSGAWIRWAGDGAGPALDNSLEINIYDHSDDTFVNPTGSVANIARAYNGKVDYDDWNLMEIFTFDDHVCVYVNGVKASDGHVPATHVKAGKVCLQVGRQIPSGGSSMVMFKDIEIKQFDSPRGRTNPVPFMGQ